MDGFTFRWRIIAVISDVLPVIDNTVREKCQSGKIPQGALLCHIRWWCEVKSFRKNTRI